MFTSLLLKLKENGSMSEKVGRQADQKPDEWQQDLNPNPMAVGRQLSVRAST
jgi:hypothetical protein